MNEIFESTALWVIILLAITAFIMFFLAGRELMLWYWKINQVIENQNETNRLLSEILKEYRGEETKII